MKNILQILLLLLVFTNFSVATENVQLSVTKNVSNSTENINANSEVLITGLDVMKLVKDESKKKNTRIAVVDMKIYDLENRERLRFFNYWTKFEQDEENSLIKFFRPKNVKGTALLTNSTDDTKDKKQWIFIPAFKAVKQLTSSDKNKSFMGSDFTYSDIAGRKLSQDNHNLIKTSKKNYFIESIPVDPNSSIYSKINYVINKDLNIIQKAVFYDLDGKKLKTLDNLQVSNINGVNIVMNSKMVNHQTGGRTILNVQSMDVGEAIKSDLFSIKGLKSQ